MRLAEYLHREGLTQTEFVRRLGLRPSTMNAYVTGRRRPPVEVAIAEATGGVVLAADLVARSHQPAAAPAGGQPASRAEFLGGIADAQAILRRYVAPADSLTEELIRERRAAAARE